MIPSEELRMIHKLKYHDKCPTSDCEQQNDNTGFVFFTIIWFGWMTKWESAVDFTCRVILWSGQAGMSALPFLSYAHAPHYFLPNIQHTQFPRSLGVMHYSHSCYSAWGELCFLAGLGKHSQTHKEVMSKLSFTNLSKVLFTLFLFKCAHSDLYTLTYRWE